VLVSTVVDRRSYPMFALLFGYGMVQLLRRQAGERGAVARMPGRICTSGPVPDPVGAVHAAAALQGDIIAPYGGIGLVVTLLSAGVDRCWAVGAGDVVCSL
jgi:uncharacterized membrane protein YeiB